MTRIHDKLLLSVLLITLTQGLFAQTPKPYFVLASPDTLRQRAYVARNYILLKPGFNYKAQSSTDAFDAKTNPSLTFNITNFPNPTPGDVSSSPTDLPYTPGTTFNSDATKNVPGIVYTSGSQSYRVYPIVWLKTVPLTNNLNGAYQWVDIGGGNAKLLKNISANNWVEYVTTRDKMRAFNFNPAIDLSSDTYVKKVLLNTSNLAQTTIMGIWGAKSEFATDKFLMTLQGRRNDWILLGKHSVVHSNSTLTDLAFGSTRARSFLYQQNVLEGSDTTFHERALRIGSVYKASKPNNTAWGEAPDAALYLGTKNDTVAQWQSFSGFQGYLPELLIFNQQLSKKDIQIYSTYLAVKYGVSLDTSYLAANGEVLWDYPSNLVFKNRITGYGREDNLGLMQKTSTTSYEERPNYAEQTLYDSNDSTDSFHPSSRYRLLIMGSQPANPINDGRYFIFGDNSNPITLTGDSISGYSKVMARKWKLQTNTYKDAPLNKTLSWSSYGQNLTFSKKYNTNVYRGDLTKAASTDSSAIVTSIALQGKDGYFAWTVDLEFGPVMAKFGTSTPYLNSTGHDYGYRIDVDGQLHKVIKGRIDPYCLFTVERGQRLEIEKNEKSIYLKVNGVRYKNSEFLIDTADINKSYYGAIIMGKSQFDFKLIDFRHGGFVNTGHKIELSYDASRASGFSNPEIGKVFLLVDPTEQGTFTQNVIPYPCDEIDAVRTKIIFNNVFWDSNTTGKYFFTFAYKNVATLRTSQTDPEDGKDEVSTDDIQIISRGETGHSILSVRIQTAEATPVTIHIYDLTGRRIDKRSLPASTDVSYSDFSLPATGLYIVKIVTKTNQYTHEVVSK
jgi:hypothetical protein